MIQLPSRIADRVLDDVARKPNYDFANSAWRSAAIILFLGGVHLTYTAFTHKFNPTEGQLETAMQRTPMRISRQPRCGMPGSASNSVIASV